MKIDMNQYGLSEYFLTAAKAFPDLAPAHVVSEYTGLYSAVAGQGALFARLSGRLRHAAASPAGRPAVGDFVMLNIAFWAGRGREYRHRVHLYGT